MFLPNKAFELFQVSKENVEKLREELASVRSERDAIKTELVAAKANFDWLRIRVNALEAERGQLMEKAYGIHVAVPEIVKQNRTPEDVIQLTSALFEDLGDKEALKLGLPTYS